MCSFRQPISGFMGHWGTTGDTGASAVGYCVLFLFVNLPVLSRLQERRRKEKEVEAGRRRTGIFFEI